MDSAPRSLANSHSGLFCPYRPSVALLLRFLLFVQHYPPCFAPLKIPVFILRAGCCFPSTCYSLFNFLYILTHPKHKLVPVEFARTCRKSSSTSWQFHYTRNGPALAINSFSQSTAQIKEFCLNSEISLSRGEKFSFVIYRDLRQNLLVRFLTHATRLWAAC